MRCAHSPPYAPASSGNVSPPPVHEHHSCPAPTCGPPPSVHMDHHQACIWTTKRASGGGCQFRQPFHKLTCLSIRAHTMPPKPAHQGVHCAWYVDGVSCGCCCKHDEGSTHHSRYHHSAAPRTPRYRSKEESRFQYGCERGEEVGKRVLIFPTRCGSARCGSCPEGGRANHSFIRQGRCAFRVGSYVFARRTPRASRKHVRVPAFRGPGPCCA